MKRSLQTLRQFAALSCGVFMSAFASAQTVPLEINQTQTPAAKSEFSASERTVPCNAYLAGITPSQIQWNVDLSSECKVTSQGALGSCWANSGATGLEPILKKLGLLPAGSNLSVDFYTASMMRFKAMEAFRTRTIITLDYLGGNFPGGLASSVMEQGVVLENEFSLPKKPIRYVGSSNVRMVDLRTSLYYREAFVKALNDAYLDEEKFAQVLNSYLGNTDAQPRELIPTEVQKEITPRFLKASENLARAEFNPAQMDAQHRFTVQSVPYAEIEKQIVSAIDLGNPVHVGLSDYGMIWEVMGAGKTTFYEPLQLSSRPSHGHGVVLTGYHLGKDGKVDWYLLQNNWGRAWADAGRASASSTFIFNHASSYELPAQ
jgi:hypothetical protein